MTKIFSPKLFVDGLNRIKAFGIVSIILTSVLAFFTVVSVLLVDYTKDLTIYIGLNVFLSFAVLMFILAPLSVYLQFKFLNKRSASDFYLALPFSRTQFCISYFTSSLVWIGAATIVPLCISSIILNSATHVYFDFKTPFIAFIVLFGSSFMLMAFMLVAMSLTGTTLSNIFVYCISAFFFRLIFNIISYVFNSLLPITPASILFGSFLTPEYFLPFSSCSVSYLPTTYYSPLTSFTFSYLSRFSIISTIPPSSIIYGYAVAVVCTVFALFLFNRRKSESADKSAVSPVFQHIFRCAVAFPTALLAVIWLIEGIIGTHSKYGNISTCIIYFMISLTSYFLYEIITKKGFLTIKKCMPQILIVFALAILTYGGIKLTEYTVLSYEPSSDEIEYIQLYASPNSSQSYENIQISNVKIQDKKIIETISGAISYSNNLCIDNTFYKGPRKMYVRITDKKGVSRVRYLAFSNASYETLEEFSYSDNSSKPEYLKMPKENEIRSLTGSMGIIYISSDKTPKDLWKFFIEEYNALSDEDKLEIKSAKGNIKIAIRVEGVCNGSSFYSTYYITDYIADKMPKTVNCFFDAVYEIQDVNLTYNSYPTASQ